MRMTRDNSGVGVFGGLGCAKFELGMQFLKS